MSASRVPKIAMHVFFYWHNAEFSLPIVSVVCMSISWEEDQFLYSVGSNFVLLQPHKFVRLRSIFASLQNNKFAVAGVWMTSTYNIVKFSWIFLIFSSSVMGLNAIENVSWRPTFKKINYTI